MRAHLRNWWPLWLIAVVWTAAVANAVWQIAR